MTRTHQVLNEIREELRELRTLYSQMVDRLIPEKEPATEEKKAIKRPDQVASEKELMKAICLS